MASEGTIRDGWARILGIPAFGIAIPRLTGLLGPLGPDDPRWWAGSAAFVALAAAIWQGNRWLLFRQREHLDWFDRPLRKVVVLLFAVVCFSAPLAIGALTGWYALAGIGPADPGAIRAATLMIVICVVFVTHVYETVFLIKARESDLLRLARLERAAAEAALEALKSQVDPHFLFNSLNTLAHLIEVAPRQARAFNDDLAGVYRYILASRERRLVPLSEELAFVRRYAAMLALRFGDALQLEVAIPEAEAAARLLPPVSLQLLVENAVKHNAFSQAAPLAVTVELRGGAVVVTNERRPRELARPGAGLGLRNLAERARLLTGRDLAVEEAEGRFRVTLPTLEVA